MPGPGSRPGVAAKDRFANLNRMSNSLAQAIQLHQQGHLAPAREAYLAILAAEPGHAEAHQFLGMLEHQEGRAEPALRHFQAAIAIDPGKGFFQVNYGNLLKDLGRPQEAEAAYRKALEIDPADAIAMHNLGHLYQKWGRWPEAREAYEAATRANIWVGRLAVFASTDIVVSPAAAGKPVSFQLRANPSAELWIGSRKAGGPGATSVTLPEGKHRVLVKLDPKSIPETVRLESPDVAFVLE